MSNSNVSAKDVAMWMFDEVLMKPLYQAEVVGKIAKQFGVDFIYTNDNGNLAVDKKVLREFKKLSKDKVVWSNGEKFWKIRTSKDTTGRGQE